MSFEGPIRPKKEKQEDPAPEVAGVLEELKARSAIIEVPEVPDGEILPGDLSASEREALQAAVRSVREKK